MPQPLPLLVAPSQPWEIPRPLLLTLPGTLPCPALPCCCPSWIPPVLVASCLQLSRSWLGVLFLPCSLGFQNLTLQMP